MMIPANSDELQNLQKWWKRGRNIVDDHRKCLRAVVKHPTDKYLYIKKRAVRRLCLACSLLNILTSTS